MDTYRYTNMHEKIIFHSKDWRNSNMTGETCTPEEVVAVTDLKSQMTKATRYVLIFTLASNWSSRRPSLTSTVLTWNSQTIHCGHFTYILPHVWSIFNTHHRHVGQRNVLWSSPDPYRKVGFEAWLIKTRECRASTCSLKMSWSQES